MDRMTLVPPFTIITCTNFRRTGILVPVLNVVAVLVHLHQTAVIGLAGLIITMFPLSIIAITDLIVSRQFKTMGGFSIAILVRTRSFIFFKDRMTAGPRTIVTRTEFLSRPYRKIHYRGITMIVPRRIRTTASGTILKMAIQTQTRFR